MEAFSGAAQAASYVVVQILPHSSVHQVKTSLHLPVDALLARNCSEIQLKHNLTLRYMRLHGGHRKCAVVRPRSCRDKRHTQCDQVIVSMTLRGRQMIVQMFAPAVAVRELSNEG